MQTLYPSNMKAICSGGIQDNVRPEEINKKAEHNDRTPKNSYIRPSVFPDCVRPRHMKWKAPFVFHTVTVTQLRQPVCPLTFQKLVWIILVINIISGHDILILVISWKKWKIAVVSVLGRVCMHGFIWVMYPGQLWPMFSCKLGSRCNLSPVIHTTAIYSLWGDLTAGESCSVKTDVELGRSNVHTDSKLTNSYSRGFATVFLSFDLSHIKS